MRELKPQKVGEPVPEWIRACPYLKNGEQCLGSMEGSTDHYHEPGLFPDEHQYLDWIVQGGESGPGARPFDLAWARKTRDQCKAAGVPWFCKQLGTAPKLWKPGDAAPHPRLRDPGGKDPAEWPEDLRVQQMPEVRT